MIHGTRSGRVRRLVPPQNGKAPARPDLHSPSTQMASHLHLAPVAYRYASTVLSPRGHARSRRRGLGGGDQPEVVIMTIIEATMSPAKVDLSVPGPNGQALLASQEANESSARTYPRRPPGGDR